MPSQKDQNFEGRIRVVQKYLRSDIRYNRDVIPRPFFLEFTGSPSAGKTTMITELDKFLRRFGLRVWRPQEGAEVIRHIERTTPVYNIRTGLYALNILLDQSVGNLYDVVIFDRCIFDAYSWMMYWQEKGKLSEEEARIFQQFFISGFWRDYLDAVFIVICDPEKAMERELRISLTKKTGETSNPKTIRTLVDRYKRVYAELSPSCRQLHLLDTTDFGEQEMIEKITGQVLNILEKKSKSP